MQIENCIDKDIDRIFELYDVATAFQLSKKEVAWPKIDRDLVETEIKENRQWKIILEGYITCVWATTFTDQLIWQEKNSDPAVYIHRISTDPNYRGYGFVEQIVDWAKDYACEHQKQFIRMDTVGENKGLIAYYQKRGFSFLGLKTLEDTVGLPDHYKQGPVSLFEIYILK